MMMSGTIVRERLETGRAVFGLVDFARAEAMQQRAQDAPHMRIVVDDEKAKSIEIDTKHATTEGPGRRAPRTLQSRDGRFSLLTEG